MADISKINPDGGITVYDVKDAVARQKLTVVDPSAGEGLITFGVDANGNYGYKKVGADTVTPFKSGGNEIGYVWTYLYPPSDNQHFKGIYIDTPTFHFAYNANDTAYRRVTIYKQGTMVFQGDFDTVEHINTLLSQYMSDEVVIAHITGSATAGVSMSLKTQARKKWYIPFNFKGTYTDIDTNQYFVYPSNNTLSVSNTEVNIKGLTTGNQFSTMVYQDV